MTFDIKNIANIEEIHLHDAKFECLTLDYDKHQVVISLNGNLRMYFNEVIYLESTIYEPWGEGIYVNEVKSIEYTERILEIGKTRNISEYLFICILLNSGDTIKISSKKLDIKE